MRCRRGDILAVDALLYGRGYFGCHVMPRISPDDGIITGDAKTVVYQACHSSRDYDHADPPLWLA